MALLMTPMLGAGCNSLQSETVAEHHVGPAGPTYPSGYYFDVSVTPHSITTTGTHSVLYTIRVWDSNGNVVSGVMVAASGADKVGYIPTDYAGIASVGIEMKTSGTGGSEVFYMTFTVEDSALTIPVQLIITQ